jgi:hypothetical protein
MTDRRGRKASSALAACVLAATALTACESDKEPDVSSTPNPSSQGELVCGFVPKAEVVAMVGSSDLSTTGTEIDQRGSEVSWGNCFVKVGTDKRTSLEVTVDSAETDGAGWTHLEMIKKPKPGWKTFPADNPTGYAHAPYTSTAADGRKQVGSFALYVRGDWIIAIRDYQPAEGRDPIADAIALTQSIATTLQLPEAPSTPYASPSPDN